MSRILRPDQPLAITLVETIHRGDVDTLRQLLRDEPGLARARIRPEEGSDISRTLLHVTTDWPGNYAHVGATIHALVDAGAEVDARNTPGTETPLHWAASGDDVEAVDALVERGADVDAPGAVIAGGTPLDDAVAFGQWRAAHRLVEHGATTALRHAAALGLIDLVEAHFAGQPLPARHPWGAGNGTPPDELTVAFWCACHGGRRQAAEYLLERGADLNWIAGWDGQTPLDTARREGADEVVGWLRTRGAKTAREMDPRRRKGDGR